MLKFADAVFDKRYFFKAVFRISGSTFGSGDGFWTIEIGSPFSSRGTEGSRGLGGGGLAWGGGSGDDSSIVPSVVPSASFPINSSSCFISSIVESNFFFSAVELNLLAYVE